MWHSVPGVERSHSFPRGVDTAVDIVDRESVPGSSNKLSQAKLVLLYPRKSPPPILLGRTIIPRSAHRSPRWSWLSSPNSAAHHPSLARSRLDLWFPVLFLFFPLHILSDYSDRIWRLVLLKETHGREQEQGKVCKSRRSKVTLPVHHVTSYSGPQINPRTSCDRPINPPPPHRL